MKATTIIAGVVVTASVGYIGYRVYLAVSEQDKPINEERALDPKDNPVIAEAPSEKELTPSPKVVPSGKVIQFRQDPEARVAIKSTQLDPNPSMIALAVPFPTRTNEQRTAANTAAMFRRDNTPAEYDIFGNRTR